MRGRGAFVAYLGVSLGLWLVAMLLVHIGGGRWDRPALALFVLVWVGATVTLYWAWRALIAVGAATARASNHALRLGIRAGRWLAPREDEVA